MAEQIADRYRPSQQMAVNTDGSINTNLVSEGFTVSSTNPLPVYIGSAVDIQVGAVEIKDGSSDTRATVKPNIHNTSNELLVNLEGHICAENSSVTPLAEDAVFTGQWQDTLDYGSIIIGVNADQNSATDGLDIQWSADGANIHDHDYFTISASIGKVFTFGPARRYVRIVYTNGGVAQSSFSLQTQLKRTYVKPSSHRLQDNIVSEDDAELVKAVLSAQKPDTTYTNIDCTAGGNLKVSLEEFNGSISTGGLPITSADSPSIDAFGRWRVSDIETIFDSKQTGVASQVYWSDAQTSGSGTSSTYSENYARTQLAVSNTTAGKRIRQTKQRFNYQPGKSQLILITFNMNGSAANIVKRVGYFDDNNGLFLEFDGTTVNFVRRTYVTGSPADNEVPQASWNIDTMDGNGASGININWSKTQIMIIDFEWLGVGRVRMGFVVDGLIYYAHEFLNANVLSEVYMSKPNLPIRYSIENNGSGAASTMDCICCSVQSEGGVQKNGMIRSANTGDTGLAVTTSNTRALLGIRLKSTELDSGVIIESISAMTRTANDPYRWTLRLNPTLGGTFESSFVDIGTSAVQIAIGTASNTVTGGLILAGGVGKNEAVANFPTPNAYKLGATISGTADVIVLCCRNFTAAATLDGVLNWRELL